MRVSKLDVIKVYAKHPGLIINDIREKYRNLKDKTRVWLKHKIYDKEIKILHDVVVDASAGHYVIDGPIKYSIYDPVTVVMHIIEKQYSDRHGCISRLGIMGIMVDTQDEQMINVYIRLKRPGNFIGKAGSSIYKLEETLSYLFNRPTKIKIDEVKYDINDRCLIY